jgi:hypothetical protein
MRARQGLTHFRDGFPGAAATCNRPSIRCESLGHGAAQSARASSDNDNFTHGVTLIRS